MSLVIVKLLNIDFINSIVHVRMYIHVTVPWYISISFTFACKTVLVFFVSCRLNLPECLPDVYVPMEDPPLGVSKGFLGGLFGTTPTTVDRERMCKFMFICYLCSVWSQTS